MIQDLRFAFRTLSRAPGFTITAAITLALGIGVTSLMFSVVNAVLLRPLPYAEPGQLMLVFNVNTAAPEANTIRATALDFEDYRGRTQSFAVLAAHIGTGFTFSGQGEPELVLGQMVSPDFFNVFGVQPVLGRTFAPEEFAPGRDGSVLLSHRLWTRRFGASPAVVGESVTINGKPYRVAGVMPSDFEYPGRRYELWAPLPFPRTADLPPANRSAHYLQVVGRLKPSIDARQADAEIKTIAAALAAQYPDSNQNISARVAPLQDFAVRDVKTPLLVLLGAVGLVVLIACANVTNLLLARATARHREVAIRQALGAGRWRLVRQFLAETAVLYTLGAAGALALASWGAAAVVSLGPADIPRLAETALDERVLAATLLLSLFTAVVFGLAPAWQGAAADPAEALRADSRGASAGGARQHLRIALVVGEVALSVVLLVGAGLALRSLVRLTAVDPGFDADGQLTFSLVLSPRRYVEAPAIAAAVQRLSEQFSTIPGVAQAGATTHLPLSGQNMENAFEVEGLMLPTPGALPVAGMRGIEGDYFAALGVPLKSGRLFTPADRAGSQPVAIVNEAFARQYLTGTDPLGRRVREGGGGEWRTVVGVIADVKHSSLAEAGRPEVSLPYAQLEPGFMSAWSRGIYFVVRGRTSATALAPEIRARAARIDPGMSLNEMQTMAALASDAIAEPRFRTMLLGTFAGLAIALASIGVFGVLSYFVTQRTREIGIRVALGASERDILRMIVGRGLGLAGVGLAIGLIAAVPLTQSMQTLLFEIKPLDVPTLALVIAGLLAVAGVASYLPARRALRIEPVTALHLE
ncbi:MAG: ABC transporter permease [Vicinamibacterales bacterium]